MVESILPLNNINHQFGKSNAVLSHIWIHSHWLHHIIHQEQALCILQDSLRQVFIRAVIVQCPTLNTEDGISENASSPQPSMETHVLLISWGGGSV